jgi:membrane fusion protein (multidrug efflux system)
MHRINKLFFSWLCITVTIVSLEACKGKSEPEKARPNPPTTVDVIIAKTQPVDNTIEANGTVTANETVELRPEVSGRLTYLNVPEGKKVAQGTVLARINSADLVAQMQKSKAQLDLAEITVKRLKTLLDVGGVNQSDYDAAVNASNNIKADMAYTQTLIDVQIKN